MYKDSVRTPRNAPGSPGIPKSAPGFLGILGIFQDSLDSQQEYIRNTPGIPVIHQEYTRNTPRVTKCKSHKGN